MPKIKQLIKTNEYNSEIKHPWDIQIERFNNGLLFWRVATLLSLSLMTILFFFTIYHISAPKYIPFVVQVNADGQATFKGVVESQKVTLNDAMIRHNLSNFIVNIRSVSTEIVTTKSNLKKAYFFATAIAQKKMTADVGTILGLSEKGNVHRDVTFEVFQEIGSSNSWQVQWREDTRIDGVIVQKNRYSGIFSYTTESVKNELIAEQNPTGFYITDFNIQEIR